jgi:hypothetical protein
MAVKVIQSVHKLAEGVKMSKPKKEFFRLLDSKKEKQTEIDGINEKIDSLMFVNGEEEKIEHLNMLHRRKVTALNLLQFEIAEVRKEFTKEELLQLRNEYQGDRS